MRLSGVESPKVCAVTLACALLLLGLGGCATSAQFPSASSTRPAMLSAAVARPAGTGPFPAVILLPGCGGVTAHTLAWAAWLNGRGYLTIAADSLGPRGVRDACTQFRERPTMAVIAEDALGVLRHARSLPDVDPARVGVMGWSYGGTAALWVGDADSKMATEGFRAVIAFYPGCAIADPAVPTLLLLGEADRLTPPGWCLSQAERLKARQGPEVQVALYPGATHSFDEVGLGAGQTHRGEFMKYDGAATADAQQRIERFLRRYLARQQ